MRWNLKNLSRGLNSATGQLINAVTRTEKPLTAKQDSTQSDSKVASSHTKIDGKFANYF